MTRMTNACAIGVVAIIDQLTAPLPNEQALEVMREIRTAIEDRIDGLKTDIENGNGD